MAPPDHYALLGISESATADELRTAYRRRARDLHPDRNAAADATAQMATLNESYALLADPVRRQAYDRQRAEQRAQARNAWRPGSFARARANGAVREQPRPTRPWSPPTDDGIRDWYAFLALKPEANSAEVLVGLARKREQVSADRDMGDLERQWNLAAINQARDVLGEPAEREVYDRLRRTFTDDSGRERHAYDNWYGLLGVRPSASPERVAERVTELAQRYSPKSRGYAYVQQAWRVLRDPASRAAYDAALG